MTFLNIRIKIIWDRHSEALTYFKIRNKEKRKKKIFISSLLVNVTMRRKSHMIYERLKNILIH